MDSEDSSSRPEDIVGVHKVCLPPWTLGTVTADSKRLTVSP